MLLNIPIYVESLRPAQGTTVYRARPLFFQEPQVRGEQLERLMTRMAQDVGKHLAALGKQARHDDLAAFTFAPKITQQRSDVVLELRKRTARCRYLFISFRQFGRRIVFTPSVPAVWFDLARGEVLRDRATEVLTRHFRDLERDDEDINPERDSVTGTAYVTPLELEIHPPRVPPPPPENRFLMLGDATPMDGAAELHRVGRCLDWQYPDELDRVHLRDAELEELTRLLTDTDMRPVLLIGPPQVGKTALLHEIVWRRVSERRSAYIDRGNVWLLAPARLISGMSYVGQWENRLLAILKNAAKREHILYFDDLLGLFHAGQSGSSSLSVAGVLKPYLERRRVRFVAEITPEAFRILRERDRGFADLFHLLPVAEPGEADTLRILIAVQRHLENLHRCCFDLEALPAVLDLQRRYGRGRAFPGKAATFLRELAVKFRGAAVTRQAALAEFQARSGLSFRFLDRQIRVERAEVVKALSEVVVGQEAAVAAAADVVSIAKARLNDPDRPLAAFLFLGPTGVGKTQCARAIANYLFGDPERMIRFDLNEFSAPGSAARLVGTFDQPEGLLTSAVRRQPFAVVLLDEIEKAHPEVFDLLLQVLGEGRLTDALGRTVDFGNALVVMTSNLGVRESESGLGFRQDEAARDALFVQAAERFFRPEFFNRLDRVIPFHRLTREQIRDIARKLIQDVLHREGLVQRKCFLQVEPRAMEHVVDQGFDPVLGARALKRAIERQLTQPVAQQLAALQPGAFTAVSVYPRQDGLNVRVQALEQVQPVPRPQLNLQNPALLLSGVRAFLRRMEDEVAPLKPRGDSGAQLTPEQIRYYAAKEAIESGRQEERELRLRLENTARKGNPFPSYGRPDTLRGGRSIKAIRSHSGLTGTLLRELASALDINEYLRDLEESAKSVASGPGEAELLNLVGNMALLQLMGDALRNPGPEQVLLLLTNGDASNRGSLSTLGHYFHLALRGMALDAAKHQIGPEALRFPGDGILVQGPHAFAVALREEGTHLVCFPHSGFNPIRVEAVPLPVDSDVTAVLADIEESRGADADPPIFGPVVRIYHGTDSALDLRLGEIHTRSTLAVCWRATLPLPAEILDPPVS